VSEEKRCQEPFPSPDTVSLQMARSPRGETVSGTVFFLPGGIEGRTLAARRPLSAVRGFVRRAALAQEPTGGSTTLAHQIQNFFPGETRIYARHVQR
jgi:hypothetical protein